MTRPVSVLAFGRSALVLAAGGLALAACGPKPAAQAAPSSQFAANAAASPTVQQLEATAAADEARARQLEAQAQADANQTQAAAASSAAPPTAGTQALGPGDETLHSGQYYKAVPIPMNPGEVYQVDYVAHGYTPVLLVLDQDKQPFSQTQGGPNLQAGQPLSTEIRPDKAGVWYVVLSAAAPGAGGTFEVNLHKLTVTPLS